MIILDFHDDIINLKWLNFSFQIKSRHLIIRKIMVQTKKQTNNKKPLTLLQVASISFSLLLRKLRVKTRTIMNVYYSKNHIYTLLVLIIIIAIAINNHITKCNINNRSITILYFFICLNEFSFSHLLISL